MFLHFYHILCFLFTLAVITFANPTRNGSQLLPKFSTVCTTPNDDAGFCVDLQNCVKIQSAQDNEDFVQESICSPKNAKKTRVCCGKYGNYINLPQSSNTQKLPKGTKRCCNPFPEECGRSRILTPSRIYGGTVASLGEFPWMARLRHRRSDGLTIYGCAGFLITPNFVLTAAHCILSEAMKPLGPIDKVQLGEHDTSTNRDCTRFGPEQTCMDPPVLVKTAKPVVHEGYNKSSIQQHHDIALIPLKSNVTFTDYIQPLCLASEHTSEKEMWLTGWGKTETENHSHVKLKVTIPKVDLQFCMNLYKSIGVALDDTQVCAGGRENEDSCSGDSGGPLMVQQGTNPWQAEGIVSFGLGCGLEGWPGVYTSIPKHMPWIRKIINRHNRKIASKG